MDFHGKLYGTTFSGGSHGVGTLFRITASGKESGLYNFTGEADGAFPKASLTALNGILYGTAYEGGLRRSGTDAGQGTVFAYSP